MQKDTGTCKNIIRDASKANKNLGWKPKCTFDDLIKEMVEQDCL